MVSIFRLRDSMLVSSGSGDQSSKRYIITAPQSDFVLFPTDMVFVLMQFDQGTQYRPLVEGKYTQWRNHSNLETCIVYLGFYGSTIDRNYNFAMHYTQLKSCYMKIINCIYHIKIIWQFLISIMLNVNMSCLRQKYIINFLRIEYRPEKLMFFLFQGAMLVTVPKGLQEVEFKEAKLS